MEDVKHSFKNTLKENLALAVYNTGYQKWRARVYVGAGPAGPLPAPLH